MDTATRFVRIWGILALFLIPAISHSAPYPRPPQALFERATRAAKFYQPAFDFDNDSCFFTSAVGAGLELAEGFSHGGNTGGCRDERHVMGPRDSNVYVRQRCSGEWCAYMYAFYAQKDKGFTLTGGHPHEWEHVVVWVKEPGIQQLGPPELMGAPKRHMTQTEWEERRGPKFFNPERKKSYGGPHHVLDDMKREVWVSASEHGNYACRPETNLTFTRDLDDEQKYSYWLTGMPEVDLDLGLEGNEEKGQDGGQGDLWNYPNKDAEEDDLLLHANEDGVGYGPLMVYHKTRAGIGTHAIRFAWPNDAKRAENPAGTFVRARVSSPLPSILIITIHWFNSTLL